MKKKSPKRLIIGVVLVLVLGFILMVVAGSVVGGHALERAKQVKALAVCTELEQAVQRFYDDNGTLPADITEDTTFSSNSEMGLEMLRVLLNQETRDEPFNGKGIKYLSLKQGDRNMDGLIWNAAGTQITGLYDPWGGPYMITLDGDFDESITVQPRAAKEPSALPWRAASWSDGKDPEKAKDDVLTW